MLAPRKIKLLRWLQKPFGAVFWLIEQRISRLQDEIERRHWSKLHEVIKEKGKSGTRVFDLQSIKDFLRDNESRRT